MTITYDILLEDLLVLVLIMMRIASFVYTAPFFNTSNTPRKVKIGFAFFVSLLVYGLYPDMTLEYNGLAGYTALVLKEVIVGLLLGAVGNFTIQIIHFAGKFMDMDIGLSMAQIMDPTNHVQTGILGSIYYYIVMMLLIVSGLHRYLITAIVDTYELIGIGAMSPNLSLYHSILEFVSDYFVIGFRITLPIFSCMLILNCVLAILAKIAPHMNMFVVGMQLKILGGISVLMFVVYMMPSVANFLYMEIKDIMLKVIEGLM